MKTKKMLWITDIHLNFLNNDSFNRFVSFIKFKNPDIVLIGGDVGEANSVQNYLSVLEEKIKKPIYFVLGNHDFYRGSIYDLRKKVSDQSKKSQYLTYLSDSGVIPITNTVGILGHDSWADGRLGNFEDSTIELNDYTIIRELEGLSKIDRLKRLNQFGDEGAKHVRKLLPKALTKYEELFVITHVPPFREVCLQRGKISSDDGLPHFSCKAMGDVLIEAMQANPHKRMTVLCGHTHNEAQAKILPNLEVIVGGATYGKPYIQQIFSIGDNGQIKKEYQEE